MEPGRAVQLRLEDEGKRKGKKKKSGGRRKHRSLLLHLRVFTSAIIPNNCSARCSCRAMPGRCLLGRSLCRSPSVVCYGDDGVTEGGNRRNRRRKKNAQRKTAGRRRSCVRAWLRRRLFVHPSAPVSEKSENAICLSHSGHKSNLGAWRCVPAARARAQGRALMRGPFDAPN